MSTKKKANGPHVDRARPKLRVTGRGDKAKVDATKSLAHAMPQSPDWPQATEAHPALQLVVTGSDAIEANAKIIEELKTQLRVAVQKQAALRHDWVVSVGKLLSTVEVFCSGSAEKVAAFGLDVHQRALSGPQPAPANLTLKAGKDAGQLEATWSKGAAHNGFVAQHATNPADIATYSEIEPSTRPHITFRGLVSGSTVHVRVAAIDPTASPALGTWSGWAAGKVR